MKHKPAVQYHDDHTHKCQKRTQQLDDMNAVGILIDQTNQQGGKERTRTDNERGIGGGGKVHRLILAAEIERTARNAQQRHLSLILPGIGKETAMIERQHQHVGDAETQGEDLSRRKPVQHQHLGGNEGGSPDRHRQEGYQMVEYIVIFRLHILIFLLMVQK